jgi:hypothetical protein
MSKLAMMESSSTKTMPAVTVEDLPSAFAVPVLLQPPVTRIPAKTSADIVRVFFNKDDLFISEIKVMVQQIVAQTYTNFKYEKAEWEVPAKKAVPIVRTRDRE